MWTREARRKATGLILVALVLFACTTPQFRALIQFPERIRISADSSQRLALHLPLQATLRSEPSGGLVVNGRKMDGPGLGLGLGRPFSIAALGTGSYTVDFRLFGLIPLRRLTVDVVPPIRLVPGGHSIGVLMKSRGVTVVGHATVRDSRGELQQPGRSAGIELGDTILRIDGQEVSGEEHAARLFERAGSNGSKARLSIRRRGTEMEILVQPVLERESGRWRVGLYIRDGAAGVGTLTFYDPRSGKFGALGHVIADAESRHPIDVAEGQIVEAEVVAVQKGRRGAPGEKISNFESEDDWLGQIERNSRFGIFGTMNRTIRNSIYPEPLPVAMATQVREGPAEILTVVQGKQMERYGVEIVRLMRNPTADGKNMIVRITDPKLLEKAGGIVQGMSGSPIIQDGRLIGAVTHVFVNDPTRGYGVLIEWMLQEAGILNQHSDNRSGDRKAPGFLFGNGAVTRLRVSLRLNSSTVAR